jgi:hypothetical protein
LRSSTTFSTTTWQSVAIASAVDSTAIRSAPARISAPGRQAGGLGEQQGVANPLLGGGARPGDERHEVTAKGIFDADLGAHQTGTKDGDLHRFLLLPANRAEG